MKKYDWFLEAMGNVQQSINAEYMPTVYQLISKHQISGAILNCCQLAQSEAPDPIDTAVFKERSAYTSDETLANSLKAAADGGYLTAVAPISYKLTQKGTDLANEIVQAIQTTATNVTPLPQADMNRLANYLIKLRDAALQSDVPSTACLKRSLFFDQGETAPVAERVRRGLNDLAAFRDDVHMASWASLDVTGPAWDAFSHIWGEKVYGERVETAVQLAEKMHFHGFSAEQYADHLTPLVERGWLTEADGVYAITETGNKVRWDAEEETNRLFYQAWNLSDDELADMQTLMKKVTAALTPPDNNDLYELAQNTRSAIGSLYGEAYQNKLKEANLPNWGLFLLMIANSHAPTPLTPDHVLQIIPYMNPDGITAHLDETAQAGYFDSREKGYHLNEAGSQIITSIVTAVAELANREIDVAPETLESVYKILRQVSQSCADAAQPEAKPALTNARFSSPAADAPVLMRIARAIGEWAAFRDDVHVTAFNKYGLPAYVWEAFSHVWGENVWGERVNTAVDVGKKLGFRGYSEEAYAEALDTAVDKGWLIKNDQAIYSLTEQGKTIREEAEQETNRLFFAPSQFLAPSQLQTVHDGLQKIQKALT